MKQQFFIVWNSAKNEGFITNDYQDAMFASEGIEGRRGNPTVGEALRHAYADDDSGEVLPMQEVEIEV